MRLHTANTQQPTTDKQTEQTQTFRSDRTKNTQGLSPSSVRSESGCSLDGPDVRSTIHQDPRADPSLPHLFTPSFIDTTLNPNPFTPSLPTPCANTQSSQIQPAGRAPRRRQQPLHPLPHRRLDRLTLRDPKPSSTTTGQQHFLHFLISSVHSLGIRATRTSPRPSSNFGCFVFRFDRFLCFLSTSQSKPEPDAHRTRPTRIHGSSLHRPPAALALRSTS